MKVFRNIVKLILGILIFAIVPILSWGITDFSGFMNNGARFVYFALTFVAQVIIIIIMPEAGTSRGEGTRTVRRQKAALFFLQILPLAVLVAAPYCDRRGLGLIPDMEMVRYFGLFLFVAGLSAMQWAEASLGELFSVQVTIQEGHRLITRGPYRKLRHPRYTGIFVFLVGISLVFRSWFALIFVAATLVVLLWRIYDEENFMHAEFGEEWETYCRTSWKMFPFVF